MKRNLGEKYVGNYKTFQTYFSKIYIDTYELLNFEKRNATGRVITRMRENTVAFNMFKEKFMHVFSIE